MNIQSNGSGEGEGRDGERGREAEIYDLKETLVCYRNKELFISSCFHLANILYIAHQGKENILDVIIKANKVGNGCNDTHR